MRDVETATILHKYRVDSKFTEALITDGMVFLATAQQLNDPFECSIADIGAGWITKQIEEGQSAGLSGFVMEAIRAGKRGPFFGASCGDIENVLTAIKDATNVGAKWDVYSAFMMRHTGHPPTDPRRLYGRLDAQLADIGIFSLSRDPAHPLMWAHYADQHRGVCLGFAAVEGSKLMDPEHCLDVRYSDDLPRMDKGGLCTVTAFSGDAQGNLYPSSCKIAFGDATLQRVISTKPTDWSYEVEARYVEPYSGLCEFPGPLAECTFGLRCPDSRRRHYIDLLESHVAHAVRLFEIKAVPGGNRLERVAMSPSLTISRASTPAPRPADSREKLPLKQFVAQMQQLIQREQYGEVIFQSDANLRREPKNPYFLDLKAIAHGRAGEHQEAYDTYTILHQFYPDQAGPMYGKACAAQELGRQEEVVPLLRHAARLDDQDASIALNLGVHLVNDPATRAEGLELLERAERLGHRRAARIIRDINDEIGRQTNGGK